MIHVFGDFELDDARFELRRAGVRVPMEPQVFEVLAFLVANHDRAVSKDELIGHVWPDRFISDAALNSRVMAARKAVGDNGRDQALIRTIHGRGYRFVGAVASSEMVAIPPAPPGIEPGAAERVAAPRVEVPVTSFVGRAEELARFEEYLARPACRLITVAGPGGVGKTRLAIEAASRLEANGADVVAVPLQAIDSIPAMICSVAAHLGVALPEGDPMELAVRIGRRPVVLVLDNAEHLARDAGEAVAALLQGAPNLRLIVTTREILGLNEEWLFALGGLSLQRGDGQPEAVSLFLEREAQAAGPSVRDSDDLSIVEEICARVDGMPLAIELAAALRRYLPREAIAQQIANDVEFLRADLRNVPERHRSIPGLLAESFRRLSVEQMRALLSLAVFEDAFTPEAAERVADAPLRVLGELVARSLLEPRDGRFALHPLLRQFARDRLGSAFDEMRAKHADYYLALLAAQREALESSGQAGAVSLLALEWHNVEAAWMFACSERRLDWLAPAAYCVYVLAQVRSFWLVVSKAISAALAATEDAPEAWRLRSELLAYRAWVLIRTTRSIEIQRLTFAAEDLLAQQAAAPSPGMGIDPFALKSLIAWAEGRYQRGLEHAIAAAARAREQGDGPGEAFGLWLQAVANLRMVPLRWSGAGRRPGRFSPFNSEAVAYLERGQSALEQAAAILEGRGERWLLSNIRAEQVVFAKAYGDTVAARAQAEQVLALRTALADGRGMAEAYILMTDICLDEVDSAAGNTLCASAEAIIDRIGDLGLKAEVLRCKARIAWIDEDFQRATEMLVECGELSFRVSARNNVLSVLRNFADLAIDRDDIHAAAEIHAFVAEHPASTAFSRALSDAAVREMTARIGEAEIAAVRRRVRDYELGAFARAVFAASQEARSVSPLTRI